MVRNNSRLLVLLGTLGLLTIAAIIWVNLKETGVTLGSDASTITEVRLASAKFALDGNGEFTSEQCNTLGKLARKFNAELDYISCESPALVYLSTPDSAKKKILRLSDENYTAEFTTDENYNTLINYQFSDKISGGFNKYGGRR